MLDLLPVRISSTKNLINIDNMKQNHFTLSFVTGLVMLVSLASCSSHENDSPDNVMYMMPEAKTMQLTVQQKALVADNNDFSFNLFRTINSKANWPGSNSSINSRWLYLEIYVHHINRQSRYIYDFAIHSGIKRPG